jgi:hypothetical protein
MWLEHGHSLTDQIERKNRISTKWDQMYALEFARSGTASTDDTAEQAISIKDADVAGLELCHDKCAVGLADHARDLMEDILVRAIHCTNSENGFRFDTPAFVAFPLRGSTFDDRNADAITRNVRWRVRSVLTPAAGERGSKKQE